MALDDEVEFDMAPPRYSVTAREILSALKSNKNLRRPSWFHYDETDDEKSCDDDVFVDALSSIGPDDEENDDVFKVIELDSNVVKDISTGNSKEIILDPITTSIEPTSSLSSGWHTNKSNKTSGRRSVEFSSECLTLSRSDRHASSSDEDDDLFSCHKKIERKKSVKSPNDQSWLRLICPSMATVMILDDDHHGIFSLTERNVCLTETVGTYNMVIMRCGGSRGKVTLSYRTEEGTAKPNRDYHHCEGVVIFEEGETE